VRGNTGLPSVSRLGQSLMQFAQTRYFDPRGA